MNEIDRVSAELGTAVLGCGFVPAPAGHYWFAVLRDGDAIHAPTGEDLVRLVRERTSPPPGKESPHVP